MLQQKQSYWQIFIIFVKIGAILIGGGMAMLPILQKEVVEKRQWLNEKQFIDMITITNSTPGPFAINAAVFLGYRLRGVKGAILAVFSVVLVPFFIIILLASFILQYSDNVWVNKFFAGAAPAVAGMILAMAVRMATGIIKSKFDIVAITIAFILLVLTDIHPFVIIVAGALTGIIFANRKRPTPEKDPDKGVV
ncbi:MAG: chromate transporter [Bacillota bacterium]